MRACTRSGPRWWRRPTLHFVVAGTLLFGLDAGLRDSQASAPPRELLRVSAAQREALRADYRSLSGRVATPEVERALLEQFVEEEVLYREALARGLGRGDRSIHLRLVQKMRFLSDDPERDDASLYREAVALDLGRDDTVVRGILIGNMRLVLAYGSGEDEPDEAALRRHLERHAEQYLRPARVDLSHVYLSGERRGPQLETDAHALLSRLRANGLVPERAAALGDPFPLGHRLARRSRHELAREFGANFADAALALAPGTWEGPIRSAYGLHLVWVHARQEPSPPSFESVRPQLVAGWRTELREERLADALAELRSRYQVELEPVEPAPDEASGPGPDAPQEVSS